MDSRPLQRLSNRKYHPFARIMTKRSVLIIVDWENFGVTGSEVDKLNRWLPHATIPRNHPLVVMLGKEYPTGRGTT